MKYDGRQAGHTMLEVMLVMTILIPLLFAVTSTTHVVSGSVESNQHTSDSTQGMREASQRVMKLLRPASVESVQAWDGTQWKAAADETPLQALRFRAVEGLPSSNSLSLGPVRELSFVRDANDPSNGKDDDGDGLIDEGRLFLSDGTTGRACIASGIEQFAITKKGRVLELDLQATRASTGRVYRKKSVDMIYLRNN